METLQSDIAYIPVRKEPSHRSEQITQLIYGETAVILEQTKEWLYIQADYDKYEGWLEKKGIKEPNQDLVKRITTRSQIFYTNAGEKLFIPHGAELQIENEKKQVVLKGERYPVDNEIFTKRFIEELAYDFMGSPYLWGGRTMFGTDCSGFSQIVLKCMGIYLPRDASQQVNFGIEVPFTELAKPGDLAFFENEESNITHVGIIISNKEIIHASGMVRKDKLDQQGIFNESIHEYTHKLRVIKRIIQ